MIIKTSRHISVGGNLPKNFSSSASQARRTEGERQARPLRGRPCAGLRPRQPARRSPTRAGATVLSPGPVSTKGESRPSLQRSAGPPLRFLSTALKREQRKPPAAPPRALPAPPPHAPLRVTCLLCESTATRESLQNVKFQHSLQITLA